MHGNKAAVTQLFGLSGGLVVDKHVLTDAVEHFIGGRGAHQAVCGYLKAWLMINEG